jgi:poly(A) polymerase
MDCDALDIMCFPEVHEGLKRVSRERIWAEVSKMVTYKTRMVAVDVMFLSGIAQAIGMKTNPFASVCMANAKTAPSFMAGFCGQDPVAFGREWKMSVAEMQEMEFVFKNSNMTVRNVLRMRLNGVPENLVVSACQVHVPASMAFATKEFPRFPVTGMDLMQKGFKPGPAMGEELAKRKAAWVESQVAKMVG